MDESPVLRHPTVQAVLAALARTESTEVAAGVRVLDGEARTAALAAKALGVSVGAIANSLVFRAVYDEGPRPLLALTSGAHRADLVRLAALCGARRVERADADFVRQHTGQPIGGVAPVGHPAPVHTLVDTYLARYPVVWAAAGHPKTVFPTTFDALVRMTGGRAALMAELRDDRTDVVSTASREET